MDELTHNELTLIEPLARDQNPALVYLASLPALSGRKSQAQALRVIAGMFNTDVERMNWAGLRYAHTAAIRAKLVTVYSASTCNKTLSAIRGVLKNAWLLGQLSVEDYMRAVSLKSVTGERLPAGRELTQGEILALMSACHADRSPAGTRDAAMIGLMYSTGVRRDEVANLSMKDYDPDTGTLKLIGKRNKQRLVYLVNGAARAMADWLKIRGNDGEALFTEILKGGNHLITSKYMAPQSVYNILKKRGAEAKLKAFTPHDLRRSFISALLSAGADLSTVSKLAGHENPQTTIKYDRRPEEAKRKTASLLHVPYIPRDEL